VIAGIISEPHPQRMGLLHVRLPALQSILTCSIVSCGAAEISTEARLERHPSRTIAAPDPFPLALPAALLGRPLVVPQLRSVAPVAAPLPQFG